MSTLFCWYCKYADRKAIKQVKSTIFIKCTNDAANEGQDTDMVEANDACDNFVEMEHHVKVK